MRIFLKILAIFVLIVTVLAAGVVLYALETRVPEMTVIQSRAIPAAEAGDSFESLREQLEAGTCTGHVFREASPVPENSTFLSLTLRLHNRCLLPMEWIEAAVVPEEGDILEERDERPKVLAAFAEGDLPLRILTESGTDSRRIRVRYYLLGKALETEIQVNFNPQKAEDEQK